MNESYCHEFYCHWQCEENDAKCEKLEAINAELLEALEKLYSVVQGECPSLLNEDSGGDSKLDIAIAAAIAKAKGEQP